jgi:hypothetical protein
MEKAEDTDNGITFIISPQDRIRTARYRGTVDDESLLAAYVGLITAPDFDPAVDDIVDLRDVSNLDITHEGMRRLVARVAELDILGFRTRVALVAPTTVAFGMGRMYELLRGTVRNTTEDIRVFREFDEAVRWLRGNGAGRET